LASGPRRKPIPLAAILFPALVLVVRPASGHGLTQLYKLVWKYMKYKYQKRKEKKSR